MRICLTNSARQSRRIKKRFAALNLRAIAVGSEKPSPLAPGVPTLAASGVPGYESETLHALLGPAKMPPATVSRLH